MKLQLGSFVIAIYILFIYLQKYSIKGITKRWTYYDTLLIAGITELVLDAITAYTVNHLDSFSSLLNLSLHIAFLIAVDSFLFALLIYILHLTDKIPTTKNKKILLYTPFIINILCVIVFAPKLEYIKGTYTNYSMGIPVYTCYLLSLFYAVVAIFIFLKNWKTIEDKKRLVLLSSFVALTVTSIIQMIFPETLISSIGVILIILGSFINYEDPSSRELQIVHEEMIFSFASLVENRDEGTGGHIKRTTEYVRLLATELSNRGYFKDTLTKSYIKNLALAAPMHDIGKIAIPDSVLKKPGRLTSEEFEIIKTHSTIGARIIDEVFSKTQTKELSNISHIIALYHHEKWNGKGYPEGLSGEDIPLAARIMAISDVFDAVSEKRCYRDALPLDACFEIIKNGSGTDFDPLLVEVFLDIRDKVETTFHQIS